MYGSAARKTLPLQRTVEGWLDRAASTLLAPDDGPAIDFTGRLARPRWQTPPPSPGAFSKIRSRFHRRYRGRDPGTCRAARAHRRVGVHDSAPPRAPHQANRPCRHGDGIRPEERGRGDDRGSAAAAWARARTDSRGRVYSANDPELLSWVQATAAFGFLEAYHTYVAPLSATDRNRYYSEGQPAAALYGATGAPASEAEVYTLFEAMRGKLKSSLILLEFLNIVRKAPVLPGPLRHAQPLFVAAAVSLVPAWARSLLALPDALCLRSWRMPIVRRVGAAADRMVLASSPAVRSCLRMGLPADYLYGGVGSS